MILLKFKRSIEVFDEFNGATSLMVVNFTGYFFISHEFN